MRRRAALAAVVPLAVLLAGCGSPSDHLRDICDDVVRDTAELAPYRADQPLTGLQYALARFALVEKAVSTARTASLPRSEDATLRRDWLDPALASLGAWHGELDAVRTAVDDGDDAAVEQAMGPALALGTVGVRTASLTAAGLPSCATAFTAPTVADARGAGAP